MEALQRVWPYLLVLAPGVFALWRQWTRERREARRDRTDLVKIAQEAAAGVITELRDELNRQKGENTDLRHRVEHLEGELQALRKTHIAMIEAKDATIALLTGEVKALKAERDALRRALRKAGIEPPPSAPAHYELAATAVQPATEPLP